MCQPEAHWFFKQQATAESKKIHCRSKFILHLLVIYNASKRHNKSNSFEINLEGVLFPWGLKSDVLFCLQVYGPMTGRGGRGEGGRGMLLNPLTREMKS